MRRGTDRWLLVAFILIAISGLLHLLIAIGQTINLLQSHGMIKRHAEAKISDEHNTLDNNRGRAVRSVSCCVRPRQFAVHQSMAKADR